jgi:hypothetical protein
MRKVFGVVIFLCIVYFLGGWIAISLKWLKKDDYFAYAGIVGGLASVAGLLALTRPALSKSDVQAIELDALRSMTATAAQLQVLEATRSKTKEEIGGLEIKRQQMELLVKKASLALFLKEQYAHHEKQILEEVSRNLQLKEHLEKAHDTSQKLAALNEEIEANPNVAQLKEIIASASRKPVTVDDFLSQTSFPLNIFSHIIVGVGRAIINRR